MSVWTWTGSETEDELAERRRQIHEAIEAELEKIRASARISYRAELRMLAIAVPLETDEDYRRARASVQRETNADLARRIEKRLEGSEYYGDPLWRDPADDL